MTTMARTRPFQSGNSEAIRLPKGIAFGADIEVVLVRAGDVVTIYPAGPSLAEMAAELAAMPAPASIEQREVEAPPEREGL